MTEVVRKGIQEAQLQLQKANEERLLEEVSHKPKLPGKPEITCPAWAGCSPLTLCSAGAAATDTCGGLCAELVFSIPSLTKGKNI